MEIINHYLCGKHVQQCPSPNQGDLYASPDPDTLIIHYTAGADAESAIRTLCDPHRQVSAHVVVGRDGQITQLVSFQRIAWHAGKSRWGARESFNQHALGIEIDNAGQLEMQDGRYLSWFGREYQQAEVMWGVHRHQTQRTPWHRFPAVQLQGVVCLCRLLVSAYGIRHILGHDEIALVRKELGWKAEPFEIPSDVYAGWDHKEQGATDEAAWNSKFDAYKAAFPAEAAEFVRDIEKRKG